MRYIVIGAGAIGGTIGGKLAASGHEVVLVARGAHLDALRAKGLTLATPDGTSTLDIPAVAGPAELDLREDDVLLLATKTQDAEALLTDWAWQPVRNTAGSAADALPVVCAIEAVCGHDAWLHATDLRRRVTAEGRAVLDAAGLPYASNKESAELRADQVQILPVNGAERTGGSSWQSLTRGTGSIEADFLNGEIVLMARERGIPVPVNEVLQRLANQAARDRRPPGSATADEVLALAALPADAR